MRRRYIAWGVIAAGLGIVMYFAVGFLLRLHELGCWFIYACSDPVHVEDGMVAVSMSGINLRLDARYVSSVHRSSENSDEHSVVWLHLPTSAVGLVDVPETVRVGNGERPNNISAFITTYPRSVDQHIGSELRDWKGREVLPAGSSYRSREGVYRREHWPDLQMDALILQNPDGAGLLAPEYFIEISPHQTGTIIRCTKQQPSSSSFATRCMRTGIVFGSIWYTIIFDRTLLPKWRDIDAGVQALLRSSLVRVDGPS